MRSANCLKNAGIRTLRELVQKSEREMLETKNFGRKSLNEIKEILREKGLAFGVLSHVALDRGCVRCAVLVAEAEHLLVDGPVARAVGDDTEHRPGDRSRFAELGDGGGLHIEGDDSLVEEKLDDLAIGRANFRRVGAGQEMHQPAQAEPTRSR